jgi:hypothetical protein
MLDRHLLDVPLTNLHADRHLLHQVITGIAEETNVSYADAYGELVTRELESGSDGQATVGTALGWLGADADRVDATVKTLEQRDGLVEETHNRPAAKNEELKRDPWRRVLLDQSYKGRPKALDADGALLDPAEFEERLSRARKLDASYAGDDGRKAFRFDDDQHLRGGVDLVKTLELNVAEQAAHAEAGQVARELDQSIAAESDRRRELRELDERQTELDSKRRELDAPAANGELMLLDQLQLDLSTLSKGSRKTYKRAVKRLRRLDKPLGRENYYWALLQEAQGEPMPEKQPGSERGTETPPGLHPGNHELHTQIQKYMLDHELPGSEYPTVLDQVMRGQVSL